MNKAGRRVRVLRGDKLPESTGDKLIAWGYGFQFFLGKLDWILLGEYCTVLVMFFDGPYLDTLEDRAIRLLRPPIIAPVSMGEALVGC